MKNLPDKIYLNFGEITKEEFETDDYNEVCKLDEFAVTFCEDKVYDTDVEYTRTDAFIEKACNAYCKVCGHYPHTVPTHICRQDCDYYRDFKRYMDGGVIL